MSYNPDYNASRWMDKLLEKLDRTKCEVTFDQHAFDRSEYWSLDLNKIEETVRTGRMKENTTYAVIARFHEQFIEVRTVWPRKGK